LKGVQMPSQSNLEDLLPETGAQPPADRPVIVVGYDGSEASRLAVEIAAERAGPEGTVVPVHATASASSWLGTPYYQRVVEEIRREGESLLAQTEELDTGLATIEPDLIEGDPADALLRVADVRGAREIVVGSRGLGRFRALLGSVSHAVIERANRPVVIVPTRAVDEGR
jgi:nucleotide-binding universal stress UspA family protein